MEYRQERKNSSFLILQFSCINANAQTERERTQGVVFIISLTNKSKRKTNTKRLHTFLLLLLVAPFAEFPSSFKPHNHSPLSPYTCVEQHNHTTHKTPSFLFCIFFCFHSVSMEVKDSTVSGSPGNTDSGSPAEPVTTQLPQVMNLNVGNIGGATPPPPQPNTATMTTAATTTTPTTGGTSGQGSLDLFGKKKRGRPRKYDSEGNLRVTPQGAPPPPPGFSLTPGSAPQFSSKRGRGSARPHASGNWNLFASLGE